MRIRTQLALSTVMAGLCTLAVVLALVDVTRDARRGLDEQAESQDVVRNIANMLALTNEFAVYGSERAATQWRARHAMLWASVDRAVHRKDPPEPALRDLVRDVDDLAPLFEKLVETGHRPATPNAARRRELLLERLLAETQEVVESRHRWALALEQTARRQQNVYTVIVLAAPAALLLLIVSLAVLIARSVLRPAGRLEDAATRIQRGDLDVRCASDAEDELGDAARAVDAMAQALQQQSAALRASEQRLRLITDNIPAMVLHVGPDRRYTFANAYWSRMGRGDPSAVIGRTVVEVNGEAIAARLEPHIAKALAGERAVFEFFREVGDRVVYMHSTCVPEFDAEGKVTGYYGITFDITERKESELRLAASQRFLQDITDNLPALVAYIDKDGCYRFANSKYRDWMGIDPAAMIGRPVREVMGDEFFTAVQTQGEAVVRGERQRWERHVARDGRDAYYLSDFIPDVGPDGEVRGFFALTIDITERREAETAVARSEQRLVALMNNMPAMVAYIDMDERCQYANESGLRSRDVMRSEVPGITLRRGLGEENYALHEPYVREALAGRRARFEARTSFQGRDAHFQAHLAPDVGPDGRQRGFYLMSFDITALKEAQQRQALVERQIRAITDNLPVLISYFDTTERYQFVNATAREWIGAEPASLIGRTMADALSAESYEMRRPHLRAALAGERVEFSLDTDAVGNRRNLQIVYIPDFKNDGSVAGVYSLSTDVTALKQVEHQLQQLARFDSLTGLPNRRQFEERLAEAVARSARGKLPIALMFLDIDHFKSINDTWGHAVGDAVLKEFGARLKRAVRSTDMPARLAGDEFVVLLEGLHAEGDVTLVAEKLVAAVRKPFVVPGAELLVTTSVGIAYAEKPGPNSNLMEFADQALYRAKGAGRDTFAVSTLDSFVTDFGALSQG